MKKFLILCLVLSLNLVAADKKKSSDEIDHVALAALLLKDGYVARANDELAQVNLEDETIDKIMYFTLKGLVATKQGSYKAANGFFNEAIAAGQTDKSIYLYIAQNSFKLQDYEGTLSAITDAGEIINDKPTIFALRAECYWRLKKPNDALATLRNANSRFPDNYDFYKQRFNYLISLQLYQSALDDANIYLANAKPNEKTSISFISALRKSGATDKAITLAEQVNLRFVDSADVTVLLAHLYLDKDMIQAAAELFDQASIENGKYTKEAAEMMRRAHDLVMALYKNSQMLDQKEKLKQRIAIYIEHGNYEHIVVSKRALERSGLIEDENIRYALAYAYYMTGEYDACENELKQLTRPDLFQKATELRKNMEKCKNNHWECAL